MLLSYRYRSKPILTALALIISTIPIASIIGIIIATNIIRNSIIEAEEEAQAISRKVNTIYILRKVIELLYTY